MAGNNKEPLVSIVIPVYNAEEYLKESLCSVLGQSYKNLEIICVDDGSTDKSLQILQRMKENDDRMKILSEDNQGAGAARNLGTEAASGEYSFFFDADDYLHKKAIQMLVKVAEKDSADIVLFGYYKFSEEKKMHVAYSPKVLKVPIGKVISPESISDRLFQADHGMPWNKFYRAEFVIKSEVKFQTLKNTNDEFFSRITTVEAKRIVFLNKTLIGYRVGNKQSLQGSASANILNCTLALQAIYDELKCKGYYEIYSGTFKKLAGYVVMLKLLAVRGSDAFGILAKEVSDNTIRLCEMEEDYLEEKYRSAFRALQSKDIAKAEIYLNELQRR